MPIIERKISNTHFLIIDCDPGPIRPDTILKTILQDINKDDFEEEDGLMFDDALNEDDFTLISSSFGEWKFGVYKDKEQLFEANLSKMTDLLTNLYNSRQIRFAEWSPKQKTKQKLNKS
jgi:hypothetical protein